MASKLEDLSSQPLWAQLQTAPVHTKGHGFSLCSCTLRSCPWTPQTGSVTRGSPGCLLPHWEQAWIQTQLLLQAYKDQIAIKSHPDTPSYAIEHLDRWTGPHFPFLNCQRVFNKANRISLSITSSNFSLIEVFASATKDKSVLLSSQYMSAAALIPKNNQKCEKCYCIIVSHNTSLHTSTLWSGACSATHSLKKQFDQLLHVLEIYWYFFANTVSGKLIHTQVILG